MNGLRDTLKFSILSILFYLIVPPLAIAPLVVLFIKNDSAVALAIPVLFFSVITGTGLMLGSGFETGVMRGELASWGLRIAGYAITAVLFAWFFKMLVLRMTDKGTIIMRILLGSVVFLAYVAWLWFAYVSQKGFQDGVMKEIDDICSFFMQYDPSGFAAANFRKTSEDIFFNIIEYFPKTMTFVALSLSLIVFQHYTVYSAKAEAPALPGIAGVRIPKWMLWVVIGLLYLFIMVKIVMKTNIFIVDIFLYNTLLLFIGIHAVNGYGVVSYYLKKWRLDRFLKHPLVIFAIVLFSLSAVLYIAIVGALFLFMLSALDILFKFRTDLVQDR